MIRIRPTRSARAAARRRYAINPRAGPGPGPGPHDGIDLAPASAYEAVTRQMVEDLAEDLREIKGRLDGLLWMVAGAMVLELVLRLTGAT